jgi:pyruvate formate lyase activating enzyme
MDPKYYRKLTKGWLEPVLDATEQVYREGKHVEISTLMVTDLSDDTDTARAVATFVGERLDPAVPLHFVRFHPDYKMTNTIRTPIDRLERAREVALGMGVQQVYLGNVYDTDATTTRCRACGKVLVTRYGLNARLVSVAPDATCAACGTPTNIKLLDEAPAPEMVAKLPGQLSVANFDWHGDVRSLHIQARNDTATEQLIYERRYGDPDADHRWKVLRLLPGESYRRIAAKATPAERGVEAAIPAGIKCSLHEVFDRAHFPTVELQSGSLNNDVSPLPSYQVTADRRPQAPLEKASREMLP